MVINKTGEALSSPLTIKGYTSAADAQVYTYSAAKLSAIVRRANVPISSGRLVRSYGANSITLLVIPKAKTPAAAKRPLSHKASSPSHSVSVPPEFRGRLHSPRA
jgi:hypothetical protein